MAETTFHLRLTNSHERTIDCILEPWGDIYPMPSGASFEIVFEVKGEEDFEAPEIVANEESFTIYAGRKSSFWVKSEGKELHAAGWPREVAAPVLLKRAA